MIQQTSKFNDFIEEMQAIINPSPEDFIDIYDATYQQLGLTPPAGLTNPFYHNSYNNDDSLY
jgi:hypothetical protein